MTQIYTYVNSTSFTLVYRCQNCWSWTVDGTTGSSSTSSGFQLIGWAQANEYPLTPSDPNSDIIQHENQNLFGAFPTSATQASYSAWATKTLSGAGGTTSKPTTSPTSSPTTITTSKVSTTSVAGTPVPTTTYDYIVVGAGAGGIPLADKLSESGKSVLLIERGPASSGRWGGNLKPSWLSGTNLTRFDVPGLDNQIWHDSAGIACADITTMAGCVLGGGTAINAGLWWKPPAQDWDTNFPTGWKSTDVSSAVSRVFSRIPGTYKPSMDSQLYLPWGYNLVGGALAGAGWQNVSANTVPDSKDKVFTLGPFMYSGGERGGPMATYLVTANARKNFKLWLNTDARRVVRSGGHITGVEVSAYAPGGYGGVVKVTPGTGRVILSAGAFGTPRILMRSGIGPQDQLQVVQKSAVDGSTMINSTQWINLPVGNNLDDHTNTDIVISHPSINFYDYYGAWSNPIVADKTSYLNKRTGPIAQSAPNIAPLFFQSITGADGVKRQLEWTARCEGSLGAPDNYSMTLSQYLGNGAKSRGRATIGSDMTMSPSTVPYLHDQNDVATVITGITNILNILKTVKGLTVLQPASGVSVTDFVNNYGVATSSRTANHWVGTAKMGTDDGRGMVNGAAGTAVVDTNTKVYGTDNLFVVDASIFGGIGSTNPSAFIVSAAEHASEKILALAAPATVAKYGQCFGNTYTGSSVCVSGEQSDTDPSMIPMALLTIAPQVPHVR